MFGLYSKNGEILYASLRMEDCRYHINTKENSPAWAFPFVAGHKDIIDAIGLNGSFYVMDYDGLYGAFYYDNTNHFFDIVFLIFNFNGHRFFKGTNNGVGTLVSDVKQAARFSTYSEAAAMIEILGVQTCEKYEVWPISLSLIE